MLCPDAQSISPSRINLARECWDEEKTMHGATIAFHKWCFPVFQPAQLWLQSINLLDKEPFLIPSPAIAGVGTSLIFFFYPSLGYSSFFFLSPHTRFSCLHSSCHFVTLLDVHCSFQHVHTIAQLRDSSSFSLASSHCRGPGESQSLHSLLYCFMQIFFTDLKPRILMNRRWSFKHIVYPCNYIMRQNIRVENICVDVYTHSFLLVYGGRAYYPKEQTEESVFTLKNCPRKLPISLLFYILLQFSGKCWRI